VSVGEVLAIGGVVRELAARGSQYSLVISTTTRTGQALARQRFGAERCFYFPLDFPWSVQAVLKRLKPSMLVLTESELWPNVLSACRHAHIPVVVVNARVSDRSFPRYMRLKSLWRPFLQMLTAVMAQSREDAWRLQQIGVPGDRIRVIGNLKFDIRAPRSSALSSLLRQHLAPEAKLLVCGSTLEGEESLLLAAWPRIVASVPEAVLLLAPRHPERFDRVAAMLAVSPIPSAKRSQWITNPLRLAGGSVFLLDSIGELASLYALAYIAFVGGSLIPAGGHNPLEPAQFGVPITMGPNNENFREIVTLLSAQGAIKILDPATIDTELSTLLQDDRAAVRLGHNAQLAFEQQAGATGRAVDAILALLGLGDVA
jgi:3-deoxy-D-manno-octulosonic-acid transferase